MSWLLRLIAGPMIWAVGFSALYALHGLGCAQGWPARQTPIGSLHDLVLTGSWIVTLLATLALVWRGPGGGDSISDRLIAYGAWIGLVAVTFTLFPVIAVSSCEA